jgi:hypothetical protein
METQFISALKHCITSTALEAERAIYRLPSNKINKVHSTTENTKLKMHVHHSMFETNKNEYEKLIQHNANITKAEKRTPEQQHKKFIT